MAFSWTKALARVAGALLLGGAAASFAQNNPPAAPPEFTSETKEAVLKAMERTINRSAFVPGVDFSRWSEFVASQKEAIDKAKTEMEFTLAVNRALQRFGFSHITLFPPDFGRQRISQTRAGIGVRIQPESTGLRVVDIFPESPAAKAGFRVGDLIFESDGKAVRSTADLAGEKGQTSKVKIRRESEEVTIEVTRSEYRTVIPETLEWKENNTAAIVKIPTFDQGYNRSNVDDIMAKAKSAKMLVLDLRGNGGGMVINLQHLMAHFLDRQAEPMGTFVGRAAVRRYEEKTGTKGADVMTIAKESEDFRVRAVASTLPPFRGRVAVLVNGGTGSASEMAAAALREIKGAKLIGQRSAGAVLASMMMPLRDAGGFWMQFPVTDYVTIKGLRIEGAGVEPDIIAGTPRFGQDDEALSRALALIRTDGSRR
jgi:carboxyl-terminal processing protease